MTRTEFFTDAAAFDAAIEVLLADDAIGSTMVASVLANHIADPIAGGPPLLVAVLDGDRVPAAAIRIPMFPMLVVIDPAIADPATLLDELAGAVIGRSEPIVGVSGRRRTAELLAAAWTARSATVARQRMSTLFFRLGTLREPVGVPGAARPVDVTDPADVALLAEWFCEFRRETGVGRTPPVPDPDMLLHNVRRGEVFTIWCADGRPVAAAGHSALRRDGSCRIAPVYTPPDHRRRGYASAVTAAAVRSAHRLGATDVTLFTDAGYPASNAVYRGLGFESVAEFAEIDFLSEASIAASVSSINPKADQASSLS